jgi:bifunctional DNA-binding transcriptional regulator/antitoxin component of YhaV-PrlF toxin-antitoxin module
MPKIKVQQRTVKAKGKEYTQYWIGLPKVLADAMNIKAGDELETFVERGDIILRQH